MSRNLFGIAAAVLIAAGSLTVTGCGKKNDAAPAVVEKTPEKPAGAPVVENRPATASAPEETTDSPSALVAALYKAHDNGNGPFLDDKEEKTRAQYFDPALTALFQKNLSGPAGETSFDFDPFYYAQDTDIKNFKVGDAAITGETATVPVTFENFGKKETITYHMLKTPAGWRISDIGYADGGALVKHLGQAD